MATSNMPHPPMIAFPFGMHKRISYFPKQILDSDKGKPRESVGRKGPGPHLIGGVVFRDRVRRNVGHLKTAALPKNEEW